MVSKSFETGVFAVFAFSPLKYWHRKAGNAKMAGARPEDVVVIVVDSMIDKRRYCIRQALIKCLKCKSQVILLQVRFVLINTKNLNDQRTTNVASYVPICPLPEDSQRRKGLLLIKITRD